MCKVSVIVPVYNSEKFIEKCLDSLISQTLKDIEILVVNDGSKDSSLAILKRYEAKYAPMIMVLNQENAGVSAARNKALNQAVGEYIAFVDSDDYVENDYIETLYHAAVSNRSDMVFCGYQMVRPDGTLLEKMKISELNPGDESYHYKIMTICMRIFRREFLQKHHIRFPEQVRGEDLPFNLTVYALGSNIKGIAYEGYFYVQHEASAMKQLSGLKAHKLPVREISEVMEYVKQEGCRNSYDFFELGVLRSFAMFIFQFGRKSEKRKLYALCDEVTDVLDKFCPQCYKNPLLPIRKLPIFPIAHRFAVRFFVCAYKHRILKKAAFLFTRF